MKKKLTDLKGYVDFRCRISVPVRDMQDNGRVAFRVDVYGRTAKEIFHDMDITPVVAAVRRMGLDPERYRVVTGGGYEEWIAA